MQRRTFMAAGTGVLALSFANDVEAAVPLGDEDRRVRRRVEQLLNRRAFVRRRTLRALRVQTPNELQEAYAQGASAMAIVEALSKVPVEDQVHPAMQTLADDVLEDIATSSTAMQAAFEEFAEEHEEFDSETLEVLLDRTEADFGALDVGDDSQRMNLNGLRELRKRARKEGLRPQARRVAKKIAKAHMLAKRIAVAEAETGVLSHASPELQQRVALGSARWRMLDAAATRPRPLTATRALGVVLCGLGVLFGGFVFFVGIACAISCGAGALVFALLGAVLIGACSAGILVLTRRNRLPMEQPEAVEEAAVEEKKDLQCGEGTHEENGFCVPDVETAPAAPQK